MIFYCVLPKQPFVYAYAYTFIIIITTTSFNNQHVLFRCTAKLERKRDPYLGGATRMRGLQPWRCPFSHSRDDYKSEPFASDYTFIDLLRSMSDPLITQEGPIVIAMKGHPGTGKSTLANAIAKSLKCPLADKDHFRDSTLQIQQILLQTTSPDTARKLLNDLSYDAMWRVVSAQLGLGLSVVVDSPLSRKAHLDRLVEIASGNGGRVVVVECKAGDEAEWRRRLESRGGDGGSGWHKPSTWQEMEDLLEGYGGCFDYDVGDVANIVLDTTAPSVKVADLVSEVIRFVNS